MRIPRGSTDEVGKTVMLVNTFFGFVCYVSIGVLGFDRTTKMVQKDMNCFCETRYEHCSCFLEQLYATFREQMFLQTIVLGFQRIAQMQPAI